MDVLDPPGINLNLQQMSPPAQLVVNAVADLALKGSIPVREPVYNRPPFWAKPLNLMKARLVPATAGFIDYLTLQMGEGLAPTGYSAVVMGWIGTGQVDPATSGVTYRFILNGQRMASQEFDVTNTIERFVERPAAGAQWPCHPQKLYQVIGNDKRLILQVNNPSGVTQRLFAALYGYFYPNLLDLPRSSIETGALNEDGARDIGQGRGL